MNRPRLAPILLALALALQGTWYILLLTSYIHMRIPGLWNQPISASSTPPCGSPRPGNIPFSKIYQLN
jgi:hypothetical protein